MTIKAVNQQINRALKDKRIKETEVIKIIDATRPTLSNGEVKAIGDLYSRVTQAESHPDLPRAKIDRPALNRLNAFIESKKLPVGDQKNLLRDAINDFLARARLDAGTTERPRGLSKLIAIPLALRGAGGSVPKAHVDVVKHAFYLERPAVHPGKPHHYWGPFSLPEINPTATGGIR